MVLLDRIKDGHSREWYAALELIWQTYRPEEGDKLGLPPVSMEKLRRVADSALSSLEIMKRAGVKMGFGTDLLGALHVRQSSELTLRTKVLPAIDVLRSACTVVIRRCGQAGEVVLRVEAGSAEGDGGASCERAGYVALADLRLTGPPVKIVF